MSKGEEFGVLCGAGGSAMAPSAREKAQANCHAKHTKGRGRRIGRKTGSRFPSASVSCDRDWAHVSGVPARGAICYARGLSMTLPKTVPRTTRVV